MRYLVLLLLAVWASTASAQTFRWDQPEAIAYPQDSSLSLAIADDTHYGFARVWVSLGVNDATGAQVSTTQAAIDRDGVAGLLVIKDGLGKVSFADTTALARVKSFQYWRDQVVEPIRAGSFPFQGAAMRWVSFAHADAGGRSHQCAGFVGGGSARFELSGYWCVQGARPITEAQVQTLVGAVGYKEMLSPRRAPVPPGR